MTADLMTKIECKTRKIGIKKNKKFIAVYKA